MSTSALAPQTKRSGTIRIGGTDPNGTVVVKDGDDTFTMKLQELVNACRLWDQSVKVTEQIRDLIDRLKAWQDGQRAKIKGGYLGPKIDGGLFYLAETSGPAYDRDFEDCLTDLDIEIATSEAFDLIRLSVLAIPESSGDCVQSFMANC